MRRVSSFWPKTPRFTRFFGVSERRRRRFPRSAPAALLPVGTLLRKPWCFWPEIRILPRRPPSCLVGSRLALVLFRSVPPCAAPHPPRTPHSRAPAPAFRFRPVPPSCLASLHLASAATSPSPRQARCLACPAKPSPGLTASPPRYARSVPLRSALCPSLPSCLILTSHPRTLASLPRPILFCFALPSLRPASPRRPPRDTLAPPRPLGGVVAPLYPSRSRRSALLSAVSSPSRRPTSHLLSPSRPRVKPAASLALPILRPASPRCPPRASHPLAPTFPSRPPRSSRSRSLAPASPSRPPRSSRRPASHLLPPPPLTALHPPPNIPHTFDDFATRRRPSCPSPTGGRPHFPRWASVAALPAAGEGLSDARPGCLCVAKSSKVCRNPVRPRRLRQPRRLRRMVVPSTMRGNEQGVDFCS